MQRAIVLGLLGCLLVACRPTQQAAPPTRNSVLDGSTEIHVLAWNVDGSDSDPGTILAELREQMPPFNVLALRGVPAGEGLSFAFEFWDRYNGVVGTRGGPLRLVVSWSKRFDLVRVSELPPTEMEIDPEAVDSGEGMALIVHLRDRQTGRSFLVVNSQLPDEPGEVTEQLRDWAQTQTLPVLAVGEFGSNAAVSPDPVPPALRSAPFEWIQPAELVDTRWTDVDGDGLDDGPPTLGEATLVVGSPPEWSVTTRVIQRSGDLPDDDQSSNCRPTLTRVVSSEAQSVENVSPIR